ncbi:hypothetical protein VPFG_00272 [Vibrio phage nt-1]|uniref:Uncharacterized protein n=1 Tax=Vibrio phage nt-1 TaxID=115992 RepID=R9TEQ9_9CAUD|nr:hypothetical protein VPFG_00272 [Vibrio phage nt-1]AGN30271.1 hypothetical protein VPFG_00272 [Vibrio phage nt-1]
MKVVYENATKHEKGLVVNLKFNDETEFRVGNGAVQRGKSFQGKVKKGEKVYADEFVVAHASQTVEDANKRRCK